MKPAPLKDLLYAAIAWLTLAGGMRVCGQPTLDDVKQQLGSRNSIYAESDIIGYAHEGTHGINSIIRERQGGTNAAYIGNGEYGQFPEPRVTLEIVRQYVPIDYQSQFYTYLHAGSSWQNQPLYILDEWSAYYAGSKTGREIGDRQIPGRTRGSDQGLRACCVFGNALVEAIEHYDRNYSHKAELAAFVAKFTTLTAAVLGDIPQQAAVAAAVQPPHLIAGGRFIANGYETANFFVRSQSQEISKQVGDMAELWRQKHAVEWFGEELPPWSKKCPISVKCGPSLGNGGNTGFIFNNGEVYGWDMRVQGNLDRLLDSVVPHEVLHTVFSTHFRQPLPRWADEGACSIVEHESEVAKQDKMLYEFLKTGRGIRFSDMMLMRDYPKDVMPLYAQGSSVAKWLIDKRGRAKFLEFVAATIDDADRNEIEQAVKEQYGYESIAAMQADWMDWISQGSPLAYQCGYGPSNCANSECGLVINPGAVISPSPQQVAPMSFVDSRWTEWRAKVEANLNAKINANQTSVLDTVRQNNADLEKLRAEWELHLKKYAEVKPCQCDHSNQVTIQQVNQAVATAISQQPASPTVDADKIVQSITNALSQKFEQRFVSIEQKIQQPEPPVEPAAPPIVYDIVSRKK